MFQSFCLLFSFQPFRLHRSFNHPAQSIDFLYVCTAVARALIPIDPLHTSASPTGLSVDMSKMIKWMDDVDDGTSGLALNSL